MRTETFKLLKVKSYCMPSYMYFYWSKWLLELELILHFSFSTELWIL